jgi:3-oxoacyl-[acyl-carrier protein] reductase
MDLKLSNKVALVTGGSRGIGRAIVERLASEGCDIVAVSRSVSEHTESLASLSKKTGRKIVSCLADLSTSQGVDVAIACVQKEFGRLDILVNNAGGTKRGDFFELSEDDWTEGFALKFYGYVRMVRGAWPLLKESGAGAIVNIIGVSARTPEAEYTIGVSVNAGLYAFTKSMAEAGTRDGVRVNAVNPGVVETDRLRGVITSMDMPEEQARATLLERLQAPKFGAPENIADTVAFLVSPLADYIQGALLDVDGGRTRGL